MSHNASAGGDDTEKSKMSEKFMNLLATAINNLSANEQNHKQFEVCYQNLLSSQIKAQVSFVPTLDIFLRYKVQDYRYFSVWCYVS